MKKVLASLALLLLLAQISYGAPFNWTVDSANTANPQRGVWSPSGGAWVLGSEYSVRLYVDNDGVMPAAFDWGTWQPIGGGTMLNYTMDPTASSIKTRGNLYFYDGLPLTTTVWPSTDGGRALTINDYVYTVVWNRSTVGYDSNTKYAIVENGVPTRLSSTGWTGEDVVFDYNPGNTAFDGSDWVAVPEPASMALFGIGLAIVAVRRVLKS